MRDINFFSIYQTKNKEVKNDKQYIFILAIIVGGLIGLNIIISGIEMITLNSQIKKYTKKYNSSEVQIPLKEAETVNGKLDILTTYEKSLSKIVKSIKESDLIREDLLVDISSSIPGDISFTGLTTNNYELSLSGISKSRTAIAELEHNLRDLSQFRYVHVNNINSSDTSGSSYSFEITAVLKEVE